MKSIGIIQKNNQLASDVKENKQKRENSNNPSSNSQTKCDNRKTSHSPY